MKCAKKSNHDCFIGNYGTIKTEYDNPIYKDVNPWPSKCTYGKHLPTLSCKYLSFIELINVWNHNVCQCGKKLYLFKIICIIHTFINT